MPRHIYFVAPEKPSPTGGLNVMYQFAEILRENGQSASVHYQSPDYAYQFFQSNAETTYSPYSEALPPIYRNPALHLKHWRGLLQKPRRRGANRLSMPGREDLVVLPEYAAAKLLSRFEGVPVVVLAQDVFGAVRGSLVPFNGEVSGKGAIRGYLTTSEAVSAAVTSFSDSPHWLVPLMFEPGLFRYVHNKKKQVLYLNRKRRDEASVIRSFMRDSLAAHGFGLVEVQKMPKSELLPIIAESLVFVSLSRQEGFGLPPAEAMAMGCIAVGYTGVGGNEFFTSDTGFPVPDDDIVGLHDKVLKVVEMYNKDPSPLDAMRRAASDRILTTYTKENTTRALLNALEEIAK